MNYDMAREINVLKYNEPTYTKVDKVVRKAVEVRTAEKRGGRGRSTGKYRVSYKGKMYVTFNLPSEYGECAGQCICIEYRYK